MLLIKEKHVYTDVMAPTDGDSSYFKVTENTHEVEDIDQEIRDQETFIRRHTFIHGSERLVFNIEDDPTAVYKVDGIEFLPEGFLELDPLLFKDEYTFDSKLTEKLFAEQQLKTKMVRRKQYWQKNQSKTRDVTIYVVNEHRSRILDYLEEFYLKNRRRMTEEELDFISKNMNVELSKMIKLQDLYLEKKKLQNAHKLSTYLRQKGKIVDDKLEVPTSLKKYFIKSDARKEISFVERSKGSYMDSYLKRQEVPRPKTPNQSKVKTSGVSRGNESDVGQSFVQGRFSANRGVPVKASAGGRGYVSNYNTGAKGSGQNKNRGKSYEILHNRNFSKKGKPSVSRETPDQSGMTDGGNMTHILHVLKDTSENHSIRHDIEVLETISSKRITVTNPNLHRSQSDSDMLRVGIDSMSKPKRSAIIAKTSAGTTLIVHKLKPTLILTDYYFHTIKEFVESDGRRTASIVTKNSNAEIVFEQDLDSSVLGNYYEALVRVAVEGNNQPCGIEIVAVNDSGVEMAVYTLKGESFSYLAENHFEQLKEICDADLRRKSTVQVEKSNDLVVRKHTFQPLLVGSVYYQQMIEELFDERGTKKALIVVKNETGQLVLSEELQTDLLVKGYQADIVEEAVDNKGKRKATLIVKNDGGQVIKKISIRPATLQALGEDYLNKLAGEVLEEVVDDEGNKCFTIISFTSETEIVLYQEYRPVIAEATARSRTVSKIRPTLTGFSHYNDMVDLIMENIRSRTPTVLNKLDTLNLHTLGEDYYQAVLEGLVVDYETLKEKCTVSKATYVYNSYFMEVVRGFMEEAERKTSAEGFKTNTTEHVLHTEKTQKRSRSGSRENRGSQPQFRNSSKASMRQSVRPSLMTARQFQLLVSETPRRKSSVRDGFKPTIVGGDYYGNIVNEMLDHPANRSLVERTETELVSHSYQIASTYYEQVLRELSIHRKRLITGATIKRILSETFHDSKPANFKDLERRYTVDIAVYNGPVFGDEDTNSDLQGLYDEAHQSNSFKKNEKSATLDGDADLDFRNSMVKGHGSPKAEFISFAVKGSQKETNGDRPNSRQRVNGDEPNDSDVLTGNPFRKSDVNKNRKRSSMDQKREKSPEQVLRFSDKGPFENGSGIGMSKCSLRYLTNNEDESDLNTQGKVSRESSEINNINKRFEPMESEYPKNYHTDIIDKQSMALDNTLSRGNTEGHCRVVTNSVELDFSAFKDMFDALDSKTDKGKNSIAEDKLRDTVVMKNVADTHLEVSIWNLIKDMESEPKDNIVNKIESKISEMEGSDDLMINFKHFCTHILPEDNTYKDSVLILTLFYHFLAKKNLLK